MRFGIGLVPSMLEKTLKVRSPTFGEILRLDQKIRDFPVDQTTDGRTPPMYDPKYRTDDPTKSMAMFQASHVREACKLQRDIVIFVGDSQR
jgi:hypothetical protein